MKYFKPNSESQFNARLSKIDNKWLFYGEGYKRAIELIEKQIIEIEAGGQDFLIYPYCYLIRHYIEIRLKEIIDEGSKVIDSPVDKIEGGHDISILWDKAQETLKTLWKDEYELAPREVKDFITELHSIDVKSDNFRYPIDKNGLETLGNLKIINFKTIAKTFHIVKYYLDGVTDGIAVAKENIGL